MRTNFIGESPKGVARLVEKARQERGLPVVAKQDYVELTGAHGALTDQADWNAAHWDMRPDALPQLEETVRSLYDLSANGIAAQAIWAGDNAVYEARLTIDEMSELIRQGRLGTHTRYVILKNVGSLSPQGERLVSFNRMHAFLAAALFLFLIALMFPRASAWAIPVAGVFVVVASWDLKPLLALLRGTAKLVKPQRQLEWLFYVLFALAAVGGAWRLGYLW